MKTYLIRIGEDGPVKIGKAFDVEARLSALQTANPQKLNIIRIVGADVETLFHVRFAHLRIRGEWFEFDREMLSYTPPDMREDNDDLALFQMALAMAMAEVEAGDSIRYAAKRNGISKSVLHRALAVPAVSQPNAEADSLGDDAGHRSEPSGPAAQAVNSDPPPAASAAIVSTGEGKQSGNFSDDLAFPAHLRRVPA